MFHRMIAAARDAWFSSPDCTALSIVRHMEKRGVLRDAQIEAVKTWLYLKLAADNRPLARLLSDGFLNSLDLDPLPLPTAARNFLETHPAHIALLEFSRQTDDAGKMLAQGLADTLMKNPSDVDAEAVFRQLFGANDYTEYLFSLPMGAGKTWLMAAFICLDLHFALENPESKLFAHNFLVLAPSGLKSSVVPSLKTIEQFDPAWVLPDDSASQVRNLLKFEILDQPKAASRSNRAKNPNVQKISLHQSDPNLMGLVAITNAEKVILDRVTVENGMAKLFEESEDEKERQANELRSRLGKLPGLAIFIDEVHHASDDEIKLRGVVNHWAANPAADVNAVVGFSGTPYLAKAETLTPAPGISVKCKEIPSIVYYYRLVDGIGNFLKRPVVKLAAAGMESDAIVEAGLREFFDVHKDTRYEDGTWAKIAIYCGTIETLEERVYPLAERVVRAYGLDPSAAILKFHDGNKAYPAPEGARLAFQSLDTALSAVRVVLLVQIGKEGWDCRSLTGVVLSQKGACPQNMVLQTSCRCLRQVVKGAPETALIYLNGENGKLLNDQLQKQHHINVEEFQKGTGAGEVTLPRYSRMEYLKLPPVKFFQFQVEYTVDVIREAKDVDAEIRKAAPPEVFRGDTFSEQDLFGHVLHEEKNNYGSAYRVAAHFLGWLALIEKESCGALTLDTLLDHRESLEALFAKITEPDGAARYFKKNLIGSLVRANVRRAFAEEWHYRQKSEWLPESASLLSVSNFRPEIVTTEEKRYYPSRTVTENIIKDDKGEFSLPSNIQTTIASLEQEGMKAAAQTLREKYGSHPQKDRSFHYLPYRTDSNLEIDFLKDTLPLPEIGELNLEVYYNGDKTLTDLHIKCYERRSEGDDWAYVGAYTPDFLILRRKGKAIDRAVIVETKGGPYARDPKFKKRRAFMEQEFSKRNPKFSYLYLEDELTAEERKQKTRAAIKRFFVG